MIRVGLVGYGLAGQAFHAPTICAVPGLELACILERHGDLAQRKYPGVRVVRTLDELLADPEIRLCVVATPTPTHFELAERCLLAGRDVVVDKPFTTTSVKALQLVELAEARGRLLTVYQNRRLDGDFLTVQRLLSTGVLGRLVSYESHYDRYRPEQKPGTWREVAEPGSGTLYDLGVHSVDQAMVLFGKPRAISAHVFAQRDGAVADDAFDVRFEYPGLVALLRSSLLAAKPGPRYLLHGTKGTFIKYGMDPQEEPLRKGASPGGPHWGEDPESRWGTLYFPDNDDTTKTEKIKTETGDYRRFYANVRDAIIQGAPLAVPARDGVRTIRAIELAYRSSREGRTIPWSDLDS